MKAKKMMISISDKNNYKKEKTDSKVRFSLFKNLFSHEIEN